VSLFCAPRARRAINNRGRFAHANVYPIAASSASAPNNSWFIFFHRDELIASINSVERPKNSTIESFHSWVSHTNFLPAPLSDAQESKPRMQQECRIENSSMSNRLEIHSNTNGILLETKRAAAFSMKLLKRLE
jgi:hypothetical protein